MAYPERFREVALTKLSSKNSITEVSEDTGVSERTLYNWLKKVEDGKMKPADQLTPEEKLNIVIETANLGDEELSEYCRKNGYYIEQIEELKSSCLSGFKPYEKSREVKLLKKELRRKEKALAEAAALLVLQKKFQDLMEDEES